MTNYNFTCFKWALIFLVILSYEKNTNASYLGTKCQGEYLCPRERK